MQFYLPLHCALGYLNSKQDKYCVTGALYIDTGNSDEYKSTSLGKIMHSKEIRMIPIGMCFFTPLFITFLLNLLTPMTFAFIIFFYCALLKILDPHVSQSPYT